MVEVLGLHVEPFEVPLQARSTHAREIGGFEHASPDRAVYPANGAIPVYSLERINHRHGSRISHGRHFPSGDSGFERIRKLVEYLSDEHGFNIPGLSVQRCFADCVDRGLHGSRSRVPGVTTSRRKFEI